MNNDLRQWLLEECIKNSELIEHLLDNCLDPSKHDELEDLMVNNFSED